MANEPISYCLKFGWGLCLKCAAGFPQQCQCKPKKERSHAQ